MFIFLATIDTSAQYKGAPVKKDKLVSVLRSRQLQTREIVNVIKSNGVDFQVNDLMAAELTGAGARPEVIEAARGNYRAAAVTKTASVSTAAKSKFTGKPLAKDALVTLLQNGVTDAQVRKNVEGRGVSFKPSATDKAEIKGAGGSVALLNLIAASYVDSNQNSVSNNTTPAGKGESDGENNTGNALH